MADNHKNCKCILHPSVGSVHQTLDEMDFERGIWNAVIYNEVDRVHKFIADGKTMDRDNSGYTALHYAARNGNEEICRKLIIEGNADVNAATNGGCTSLHRAAMMGHFNICKLLLNRGADVSLQDDDGKTALHRAAIRGNYEICQVLLQRQESLKIARDHRHKTAYDLLPHNVDDALRNLLEI